MADAKQLREQLLAQARDSWPTEEVAVPELSAEPIRIRQITAGQYAEALLDFGLSNDGGEMTQAKRERLRSLYPRLVAWSVVDEEGVRVFQDGDAQRIEREWPHSVVDRIGEAVLRLSGATGGKADAARGKGSTSP